MTWTNITTTTTVSASRAVTLPARFRSEPIKILALHPGTGIGGTLTIWDENGSSVQVTRLDANSTRYEAEFYSDVDGFNFSFAADGNGTLAAPGVSVYLTSRSAPDPDVVDGSISMPGAVLPGAFGDSRYRGFMVSIADALADGADCNIICIGDSITQGATASYTKPWPTHLKNFLAQRFPGRVAHGWHNTSTQTIIPERFTLGTGWVKGTAGLGMGCAGAASFKGGPDPAGSMTFTPYQDDDYDTFDVIFARNSGYGTVTLTATGGTPVVQSTAGSYGVLKASCSAAALNKTNVLTLTATGTVYPLAFCARNSTKKQILVGNMGVGGSRALQWAETGSQGAKNILPLTTPKAVFFILGANDAAAGGSSAETFITAVNTVVKTYCSGAMAFILSPTRKDVTDTAANDLIKSYEGALQTYANENGFVFVPVGSILGDENSTEGLWGADKVHFTDKGYAFIGALACDAFKGL